jgi:L-asparaginase
MEVTVLAAGGTIAMAGDGPVVHSLDAEALARLVDVPGLRARTVRSLPGVQLTTADALAIARAAVAEAAGGRGVVVTHGTDTLEETAYLTDRLHAGEAPIVFTGAMRPASARGADGPANLADAVAVAGSGTAAGLGALVVFAGEVHAARDVRKADSVSPAAFRSPRLGPLGHVVEGRVEIARRPERVPALEPSTLDFHVPVVPAFLGADGRVVRAAAVGADGLVAVVLGAGHTPPGFLAALHELEVPVLITVRPERGAVLQGTYGFDGSELGLAGLETAAELSPQAARIELLCRLGAR